MYYVVWKKQRVLSLNQIIVFSEAKQTLWKPFKAKGFLVLPHFNQKSSNNIIIHIQLTLCRRKTLEKKKNQVYTVT